MGFQFWVWGLRALGYNGSMACVFGVGDVTFRTYRVR